MISTVDSEKMTAGTHTIKIANPGAKMLIYLSIKIYLQNRVIIE